MSQRDHERISEPGRARTQTAVPGRGLSPVLALQRTLGNRATTSLLARKDKKHGTFENSVQIGRLGPIEVKDSNVGEWLNHKTGADDLVVTAVMGPHSDELKRLSESKTKLDTIDISTVTGQNSWVTVTFRNARIRGYMADSSDKAEQWKATGFDTVNIKRLSIGAPRP
jgi:hypothetical protein